MSDTLPMEAMINLNDFTPVAKRKLGKVTYDYYRTGAEDEATLEDNVVAWRRYKFRPRVLVRVGAINLKTNLLGIPLDFPVIVSPTAFLGRAHPQGEEAMCRAATANGLIFCVSGVSSFKLKEVMQQRTHRVFYQFYASTDVEENTDFIRKAEQLGCTALVVTVDMPVNSKRETDMRNALERMIDGSGKSIGDPTPKKMLGITGSLNFLHEPDLDWDTVKYYAGLTNLPLIIKGIQCGADAIKAAEIGCKAIFVSNHGGRQLDHTRATIDILREVMHDLRNANLHDKLEVIVDGGVRRGSDVVKALALGARCVGVGRPFVYALGAFGEEGITKAMQLLKEEVQICMQLNGVTNVNQLNPSMILTRPSDTLSSVEELDAKL